MFQDELDKVEQPAVDQLITLGWDYIPGAQLSPDNSSERAYYRDVLLVNRLEAALRKLNSWISEENLRKVMREITHPNYAGLMEYNHAIYQMMVNYLSVEQDLGKGRKGQTVKIIDFENSANNDFLCTSQFKIENNGKNIIPDILCFVNGIPLAVIECKSPYVADAIGEGINQLRRYANLRYPEEHEGAEKLFWYNQLMVSTCRDQAKVGTISSSAQHYGDWKDAYPFTDAEICDRPKYEVREMASPVCYEGEVSVATPVTAQQRLIAGMFSPANFLDLIQNFTIFEAVDGRLIKKVARYQQYRAVNKVIERLKTGVDRKEKSGVVWHTQGSGKSLTMVMLAMKMRRDPELKQYKLVFVTDRTQLDTQLSATFGNAQSETIYNAKSVASLKELLSKDSSDIVTAMVQKFQDAEAEGDFKDLNPSDKIIVMADEAHRTQFGNLAATINAALPNAPKIGFTGTPLLKTQKMDQAFGGYIDQYKINEAVEDGATVRIIYEGRQVQTDVVGDSLDALFEEYFKDYSPEEKKEIKQKYGVERAVREAPNRIRWVCIDLLNHYREHIQPNGFKGMIVVGSRYAATLYKKTLDELGAPPSEVIISGKHNDEPIYAPYTNSADHKRIINNFTKPLGSGVGDDKEKTDPTAFLIVKDMLLTGFDAPIAQVMYIDRSLKDHTLMQAIARVNRTCSSPNGKGVKQAGFVVDYYGLSDHLTEALDMFSSDDVEGTYHSLKDEIPKLKAAHTNVAKIFSTVKGDDIDDYVLFLKNEDTRQQFELAYKKFAKQMDVILPDVAAKPFVPDLKFWGKVQSAARNRYRDPGLNISDAGEKVRKLVEDHIISTGVDPKIPPVDLMAANFKEEIDQIKSPESRASEIESAIKHHITVNLEEDPEFYKSLSLRLREIIEQTNGKWEQQLELLLNLVSSIEGEHQKAADDLGLTKTELAFYNILMKEVTQHSDDGVLTDEIHEEVKATSQSLVQTFDEATRIVDFFAKPDEVKRMKKEIKRAILDCSYGDKAIVAVVQDRFMELAKTKFR
ncbi:type I restriction endonuclease subunit R [Spongiibacter taiwanensis]|uniref:type I restriction endonuclease subunit R n=1 Tax=Spongiibacter taiwanensis TaxID=1748242 RepID=UPI002035E089|nr:type I restriction endonuclease subunit R [Spongiibacter taiwanensis]USA44727.1 type I restriction endonuclease subunit R [Spongiibacter taiwanensis]